MQQRIESHRSNDADAIRRSHGILRIRSLPEPVSRMDSVLRWWPYIRIGRDGSVTIVFVLCTLIAPLLLVLGLAVATAGRSRALNSVDYHRVDDPVALHRWVGRRLIVVAAGVAAIGVGALVVPNWAPAFGVLLAVWLPAGIGLSMAGVSRFVRLR